MRGFGDELTRRFAPRILLEALQTLTARLGSGFRTLQIITDDPLMPWELMRWGPDGGTPEFLGVGFDIARWHLPSGGGSLPSPPQSLVLADRAVVAPQYLSNPLPGALREADSLVRTRGFHRVEDTLAAFVGLFTRMNPQDPGRLIHFSGHGVTTGGEDGVPRRFALRLADGDLDLLTWRGLVGGRPGLGGRLLVFLNACDLGGARRAAGAVEGWAPALLEAGAAAVIGGLWPLGDLAAEEFALAFHASLGGSSRPVAELLRQERRRFDETGDPTWLAYVLYGDPGLTISLPAGGSP